MRDDIEAYVNHFYKSPLGQRVADIFLPTLFQAMGKVSGRNILIIGPAPKELEKLKEACAHIEFHTMQGTRILPVADDYFDLVVVLHSIEFTPHMKGFLREMWRVTKPLGKVFFIIPNRRGFLTRSDLTPFGVGEPFTRRQFRSILGENLFTIMGFKPCLSMPVWSLKRGRLVMKILHHCGKILWPRFCGIYLVEATKIKKATINETQKARAPVVAPSLAS